MQQKIRCVLLGLGNQAFEHLTASIDHTDVEIIAGIDQDQSRWKLTQDKYVDLNLTFFASLQELKLANFTFDAFILALPHHVYTEIWQDILAFNKPLLKEKPLGRDYQEAKKFMQLAHDANCGLQTAIQRRQHPSYQFLAHYLSEQHLMIDEIHAHLHLGKGQQNPTQEFDLKWRGSRQQAGGGALLDAGYHLIDLIQYLIGDFQVVSATMWNGDKADNGEDIEDRSWLFGCTSNTWIMLDTWVKGEANTKGGFNKSEQVKLSTNRGVLIATREGVWLNDDLLFSSNKEWQTAMQQQLTDFANNIRHNHWQHDVIWDQLPAMRKIEEAYWLSSRY